jgi:hypothetical protein
VDRGLLLKGLQCESTEFHSLCAMASHARGVPHPGQSGSYEWVHCGAAADAAAPEAVLAKIQQEREAHAQGAQEAPEP